MRLKVLLCTFALMGVFGASKSKACSWIFYEGPTVDSVRTVASGQPAPVPVPSSNVLRIVGRSLDWRTPIPTNLYVYPRGMKKKGHKLSGTIEWTSKYGAIYAVSYDGGITEGMNEKGLVINGLFCKGTVYGNVETEGRPPMSLAMFVGWLLDMNATTPEVIAVLKQQNFDISGATFDGGTVSALHWGVADAEGRTAIVEFDHGKINIYEDNPHVLTNDPDFPDMNAINNYWLKIGGAHFLPGTVSSPDRFVRGFFFDQNVAHTNDLTEGFPIIRSILQNVSVPYHYMVNGDPNVSSTQWRTFSNLRDRLYYFDLVSNYGTYYIDLKKCDLRPGASVMRLDNTKSKLYVGDATSKLEKHAPFTPMY